jgi:Acyl-CoA dehydrogenase, C-terminal domain
VSISTGTLASAGLSECELAGREAGLAAGLALALSGTAAADVAPGRYAAVPAEGLADDVPVLRHRLADAEGIVFLDRPGERPADAPELAEVGRLLAAVRIGLLRRILDQVVEHLSGRLSGGEPLIRKQLIAGAVADVMAGLELLRGYAAAQRGPVALADVHNRLDELGWEVATLYGAAGYLSDGPGRALHVSSLAAGTWVPREGFAEQ